MARPIRHRGKWRIRWTDAYGERQSEVYTSYRHAEHMLRRHKVEAEEIRAGLRPATWGPRSALRRHQV